MDNESDMAEAMAMLAGMHKDGEPVGLSLSGSTDVTCACGKVITAVKPETFEYVDDGVMKFENNVCRGCKEGKNVDSKHARFVCVKCRKAWMRVAPGTDKTGFKFIAGKTYHTSGCPYCLQDAQEGTTVAVKVLEKVIHNRKCGLT